MSSSARVAEQAVPVTLTGSARRCMSDCASNGALHRMTANVITRVFESVPLLLLARVLMLACVPLLACMLLLMLAR
eukprot:4783513-Pleurochrysis_carterae.AAC.1